MKFSNNLKGRLLLLVMIFWMATSYACGDDAEQEALTGQHDFEQEIIEKEEERAQEDIKENEIIEGMILIPEGSFRMGSPEDDPYFDWDESPQHEVYLDDFYIDPYEVTYSEFKKFLIENPDWQKGKVSGAWADTNYLEDWSAINFSAEKKAHPVRYVSWYAASAYANWVHKDLPTEAQWEKAARAGHFQYYFPWGNEIDSSKANYNANGTKPVGSYPPNDFGLYDMIGNLWEWCRDYYDDEYYSRSAFRNPKGPVFRRDKVLRGGGFNNSEEHMRVSDRYHSPPEGCYVNTGFRCVYNPDNDDDE